MKSPYRYQKLRVAIILIMHDNHGYHIWVVIHLEDYHCWIKKPPPFIMKRLMTLNFENCSEFKTSWILRILLKQKCCLKLVHRSNGGWKRGLLYLRYHERIGNGKIVTIHVVVRDEMTFSFSKIVTLALHVVLYVRIVGKGDRAW